MKNLRILIVEDDGLIAAILRELLAAMGHDVCACEATQDGAAAAAARLRPDMILVDVGLANGDGPAAMAAISRRRATAHVYMTGAAPNAKDLPPDAVVLRKPFDDRMLARAIERALAQPQTPPA